MIETQTATELLQQLSADEIRQRLATINAERKALQVLLRAAIRMQNCPKREAVAA